MIILILLLFTFNQHVEVDILPPRDLFLINVLTLGIYTTLAKQNNKKNMVSQNDDKIIAYKFNKTYRNACTPNPHFCNNMVTLQFVTRVYKLHCKMLS